MRNRSEKSSHRDKNEHKIIQEIREAFGYFVNLLNESSHYFDRLTAA